MPVVPWRRVWARRGISRFYRWKMHASLKRNFQLMPGARCLALLCKHIPGRYEHLVRYVGHPRD